MRQYITLLILMLFSNFALAAQDEMLVSLRSPYSLFDGAQDGEARFLSDYTFRGGFGSYLVADDHHYWQFKSAGDLTLVSLGKDVLWRAGVYLEGIADGNNNIHFRIAQSLYEVFTAIEGRVGPGVVYGGYRHRCKHGADNTDARIIMRSGPELGYNMLFNFGSVELIWNNQAQAYITGQNKDFTFHPRAFFGTTAQVEYLALPFLKFFASAGLGVMVVGNSVQKETGGWKDDGQGNLVCENAFGNGCGSYSLLTPAQNVYPTWVPAGALGVQFLGERGDLRIYSSVHSNLDTGFTQVVKDSLVVSLMFEFVM